MAESWIKGEKFEYDDDAKMAVLMGSVEGGVTKALDMGFESELDRVKSQVKDWLTPELETIYQGTYIRATAELHLSEKQAEYMAFDAVATEPQGAAIVSAAVEYYRIESTMRFLKPRNQAQALAWEANIAFRKNRLLRGLKNGNVKEVKAALSGLRTG